MLGLYEVQQLAETGEWDSIIVDCASTADALRMLTLPGTLSVYLERAWPRHRRLGTTGTVRTMVLVDTRQASRDSSECARSLSDDSGIFSFSLISAFLSLKQSIEKRV